MKKRGYANINKDGSKAMIVLTNGTYDDRDMLLARGYTYTPALPGDNDAHWSKIVVKADGPSEMQVLKGMGYDIGMGIRADF